MAANKKLAAPVNPDRVPGPAQENARPVHHWTTDPGDKMIEPKNQRNAGIVQKTGFMDINAEVYRELPMH